MGTIGRLKQRQEAGHGNILSNEVSIPKRRHFVEIRYIERPFLIPRQQEIDLFIERSLPAFQRCLELYNQKTTDLLLKAASSRARPGLRERIQ